MDSPPVTVPATLTEEHLRLLQVFHPYAWQKYHRTVEQRTRFVHYTSADTVMRIFQTQEVRMRNATCVNDFMEINHGFDCLQSAYKSNKEKLQAILDGLFPGFCTKLEERFNEWLPHFRSDTYIACVSEHGSEESGDEEDEIGRLSMWRAYGGITGVAVVMNGAPFLGSSSALNAYTSPVAYFSEASFGREFSKLLDGFAANAEMLGTLGEEQVLRNIFEAFRCALVCTKHPGFREEREWRVIYKSGICQIRRTHSRHSVDKGCSPTDL